MRFEFFLVHGQMALELIEVRRLLLKAEKINNWLLSESEYQEMITFNFDMAKKASPEQQAEYRRLLQRAWEKTVNGTSQHGLYIAIRDHFSELCPEAVTGAKKRPGVLSMSPTLKVT